MLGRLTSSLGSTKSIRPYWLAPMGRTQSTWSEAIPQRGKLPYTDRSSEVEPFKPIPIRPTSLWLAIFIRRNLIEKPISPYYVCDLGSTTNDSSNTPSWLRADQLPWCGTETGLGTGKGLEFLARNSVREEFNEFQSSDLRMLIHVVLFYLDWWFAKLPSLDKNMQPQLSLNENLHFCYKLFSDIPSRIRQMSEEL